MKKRGPYDLDRPVSYTRLDDGPVIKKLKDLKKKQDSLTDSAYEAHKKLLSEGFTAEQLSKNKFAQKPWDQAWDASEEYRELLEESELGHDGRDYSRWAWDKGELDQITPNISIKKRGLKLLGKALPIIGAGMALTAPDMAQAAVDFVIPGGVESMGVSDEQKMLDQQYKARIRQRQEHLNNL